MANTSNVTINDVTSPTYVQSLVTDATTGNAVLLEVYAGFVTLQAFSDDTVVAGTYKSFLPIDTPPKTVRGYGSSSSQDLDPIEVAVCVGLGGFSTQNADSSVSVNLPLARLKSQSFGSVLGNPHCLVLTVNKKYETLSSTALRTLSRSSAVLNPMRSQKLRCKRATGRREIGSQLRQLKS